MKQAIGIILCAVLLASTPAIAKRKKNVLRGGLGFLFSDMNTFVANPGQMARNKGFALQGGYVQTKVGTQYLKSTTGSLAYANGNIGFGAQINRTGFEFDTTAADTAAAALGFAVSKQKLTFGLGYTRLLESGATNDGTFSGAVNFNANPKGPGPSVGVGATRTMGATNPVTSGFAAFGYAFKRHNNNFEVAVELPNIDNTNNYTGHAYFTLGSQAVYFSGGYNYIKSGDNKLHGGFGRLGFIIAKKFDLSFMGSKIFENGYEPVMGGTLRFVF